MSAAADPNATDQRAAWNGAMGERWLEHHRRLHRFLEPFGQAAMTALGDLDGRQVLDIGCGTGETTEVLADAVGKEGQAIGVDISEPLIAAAQERHAGNAGFFVADAGTDELGGPFEACTSRFGTMFFPRPSDAFTHVRSHLSDSATLAMVVWQAPSENEWVRVPLAIARDYLNLPAPAIGPGPFSLSDPTVVSAVLEAAGFGAVQVNGLRRILSIGENAPSTAEFLLAVLPTGPLTDQLDRASRETLTRSVAAEIAAPDGTASLEGAAWLVTAHATSRP